MLRVRAYQGSTRIRVLALPGARSRVTNESVSATDHSIDVGRAEPRGAHFLSARLCKSFSRNPNRRIRDSSETGRVPSSALSTDRDTFLDVQPSPQWPVVRPR